MLKNTTPITRTFSIKISSDCWSNIFKQTNSILKLTVMNRYIESRLVQWGIELYTLVTFSFILPMLNNFHPCCYSSHFLSYCPYDITFCTAVINYWKIIWLTYISWQLFKNTVRQNSSHLHIMSVFAHWSVGKEKKKSSKLERICVHRMIKGKTK